MPKSTLTWYKSKARRIVKDLRLVKQSVIATELNESQQVISYRMRNVYQKQFEDTLRLLALAGYEVVESEVEQDD